MLRSMKKIYRIELELLNEIEDFSKYSGISGYKLLLRCGVDHRAITKLRTGKQIRSGTINIIRNYIANYKKKHPPIASYNK